jgi:hypothetical protein
MPMQPSVASTQLCPTGSGLILPKPEVTAAAARDFEQTLFVYKASPGEEMVRPKSFLRDQYGVERQQNANSDFAVSLDKDHVVNLTQDIQGHRVLHWEEEENMRKREEAEAKTLRKGEEQELQEAKRKSKREEVEQRKNAKSLHFDTPFLQRVAESRVAERIPKSTNGSVIATPISSEAPRALGEEMRAATGINSMYSLPLLAPRLPSERERERHSLYVSQVLACVRARVRALSLHTHMLADAFLTCAADIC